MMILGVLLFSVITFVSSLPSQVPYIQSVEAIANYTRQLESEVLSMTHFLPDITDGRRHYAILLTHIMRVADRMKWIGPEYDFTYIHELPDSVGIGLSEVSAIIKITNDVIGEINNRTKKIRPLIDTLCLDKTRPEVCNQIIHQAVVGDPIRYDEEANMLLNVGDIANDLLQANLVKVAYAYQEIKYLIMNIDALNPLVFKIVDVIHDLDNV